MESFLLTQGCTIAIEFAKITEHFLNLLNSIVIEPRSVSKCKKSEGRYCYWYWTSRCMIIEFICVIEILSLCILLLKLRLNCRFSSSTIATEIEKGLCAYCYWSWDWNATFPHSQVQPKLKSYCVHTATEAEIELPLFLTHNCNRNWKAIVYRIATVTEIEDNNFHYHDCHRYWKLDWALAETDVRLKFSAKLLSLLLLLHLIFSIIVTDVDTEQNIFVTVLICVITVNYW